MRVVARWIVGYGLLLLACNALDALGLLPLGLRRHSPATGWAGGLLVIAAGLAAAQQRRSLRITGLYISIFLPLLLAGIYGWMASQQWRDPTAPRLPTAMLSFLSLASISMIWLIVHLRPREGIATRGYAVAITPAKPPQRHVERPHRRSEVG